MKSLLAILVFVGVAFCNSTNYYGWTPNRELVYRFETQVLTGIPEINRAQVAGVRLSAVARVQSFADYSLRVKFEDCKFWTINGEVNLSDKERLQKGSETEHSSQETPIPEHIRKYLESPFAVHHKRGLVQKFFVDRNEPVFVSNIKRSFLSQIQLDISGARRNEIQSNHIPLEDGLEAESDRVPTPVQADSKMTYFTTSEETVLGDCQTSYMIHPLPKYQAQELEQEWKEEEKRVFHNQQVQQEESAAHRACQGKEYFKISKTKNLNNCKKRPIYQNFVGVQSKCDGSQAGCPDVFTHMVSTTCYVCGEMDKFVIRKCFKKDVGTVNPFGYNTEEKIKHTSTVLLELLEEKSPSRPIEVQDGKEKDSLIFELIDHEESRGSYGKEIEELGIKPVLPLPKLLSSPSASYRGKYNKQEIKKMIVEELKKVSKKVFESPESCSASGDASGTIAAISKYMVALDFDDLKNIRDEILSARHSDSEQEEVMRALFYDILSSVGTNPAIMLVKKDIEEGRIYGMNAINVLQTAFRSVSTPTEELLKELFSLVKKLRNLNVHEQSNEEESRSLYSSGLVQMSNLLHRACVNPSRKVLEFPVRIYGEFCSNKSSIITESWIPYLVSEIKNPVKKADSDEHFRLVSISALGKIGHVDALRELTKVIEGSSSEKPIIRSVAVYSLKRIARLNPVMIKPLLLAIIDNPAETTTVRIAAVSVLPWAQPSTAQLQKIAVRTWFEPSKQVSSFIYSTLKYVAATEVPELRSVGVKAKNVMHMVKPHQYGLQFSQNLNYGEFLSYLKTAFSKKISWAYSEEEVFPAKVTFASKLFNSAIIARGLTYSVYTQGMDHILQRVMYPANYEMTASNSVREQLEEIQRELNIESAKKQEPIAFFQQRFLGYESSYTLSKHSITDMIERLTKTLTKDLERVSSSGKTFRVSRAIQVFNVQNIAPTAAGILTYAETVMPTVYSAKGFLKTSELVSGPRGLPIPKKVVAEISPVINSKIHTHVGVMCPFTHQFIGVGIDAAMHVATPLKAEVEISMGELTINLQAASSNDRTFEPLHLYILPYTVVKNVKVLSPMSHSSNLKEIVSKVNKKVIDYNVGKAIGISSSVHIETDAKFNDLYSWWEQLPSKRCWLSVPFLTVLPSSVRQSSLKYRVNPSESKTKSFSLHLNLDHAKKIFNDESGLFEVEQSYNDEHLIHKICNEQHELNSTPFQMCQRQLNNLEEANSEVKAVCQEYQFENNHEERRCHKTANICHKALKACEESYGVQSERCQIKKEQCLRHVHQNEEVKKSLKNIGGQEGHVRRLHIKASANSRDEKRAIKTVISYAASREDQGKIVKVYAGAEVQIPRLSSIYEVAFEAKAKLPQINHRWNTEKLVEEELKVEVDGKLKYGRKDQTREVKFQTLIEKTEDQKKSVKQSPEWAKCLEQEQKNMVLAPVCMKVRNQASAIDKAVLKIQFPNRLDKNCPLHRMEDLIKAYFMAQLKIHSSTSTNSENEVKIVVDLSRAGDEAQLEVETSEQRWSLKDIRLPKCMRGFLPLTLRNSLWDRVAQSLTHNQSPSTCSIEQNYVSTFDNKTYDYQLNDCVHVLFMDRSNIVPVAVLAKSHSQSESKVIEILSGISKLTLKPKSSGREVSGLEINMKINDEHRSVEISQGETKTVRDKRSNSAVAIIKRYRDNVYNIYLPREMWRVITDGVRIEIVAPRYVGGRSCGLCGDFNGENTADMQTPRKCLMEKDSHVAYSYMVRKQSSSQEARQCSGIPSHVRSQVERQEQECVKKQELWTRLETVYHNLWKMAKPSISVHLVEKQVNAVCISRQKVKICSQKTLEKQVPTTYLEGLQPLEVRSKLVEYSCVQLPSPKGYSLEKRAKGGENLFNELEKLPVMFSRVEYEPTVCRHQSPEEQRQLRQELHQQQQN